MVTTASSHQGTTKPADAEEAGERGAVQPVHRGLDGAVGQEGEPRGSRPGFASKGGRDIGVEGAVGLDFAAHRHEPDGEDHDDNAHHQVRPGRSGAVAEGRGQRRRPDDSGQRRLGGQDKEENAHHADAAGAQCGGVLGAGSGFRGPGLGFRNTHRILLNGHESGDWRCEKGG